MTAITATMTPLAASSASRLPDATQRRPARWAIPVSVLLHVALLVVAIVAARHQRSVPQAVPPAAVAMVFEGGSNTPPSIANPAPVSPNRQASPEPQPAAPPPPPAAPPAAEQPPPPAVPPVEQPPPPAAPPVETPPPQEVVPPPQQVAPPAPEVVPPPPPALAPPAAPQPLPELSAPPSNAPAAQAPTPEAVPLPLPPPPLPAPEAAPRPPRPREVPRPVTPPRAGPAFPAPMEFSFGPRIATPEAAAPRPRASQGTIDLSFAPTMGGGDITQLHPQGKGDDVGEDWFNEVEAWWHRHRFYPSEAGRLQQEGDVELRLVVGRDGRVKAVDVEQKSGSPWLDLGALAVFRDAKLPPLPPDVRDPNITVNFTIHYVIIR